MSFPSNLELFVVYHKRLHPAFYVQLSGANLRRLTFYKVNEEIPFESGLEPREVTIVQEYDLPIYDPFYQAHAFNEGSCMIHVYQNNLAKDAEYVGIVQYDMSVSDPHLNYWGELMGRGVEIISPCHFGTVDPALCDQDYVMDDPFFGFPMAFFIDRFCRMFDIDHQTFVARMRLRRDEGQQLSLYNSFIVRKPLFDKLAAFVLDISKDLYAQTVAHPEQIQHHGHMGGIIERCVGLFFLYHAPDGQRIEDMGIDHATVRELHRTNFGQI